MRESPRIFCIIRVLQQLLHEMRGFAVQLRCHDLAALIGSVDETRHESSQAAAASQSGPV